MAAAGAAAGAANVSTPGLSSVEVPPAVPEVMEPGTCSLLDADVAPHWPTKPGVYIRGAFTRQMGQQQITRMGGGARCGAWSTMLTVSCVSGAFCRAVLCCSSRPILLVHAVCRQGCWKGNARSASCAGLSATPHHAHFAVSDDHAQAPLAWRRSVRQYMLSVPEQGNKGVSMATLSFHLREKKGSSIREANCPSEST